MKVEHFRIPPPDNGTSHLSEVIGTKCCKCAQNSRIYDLSGLQCQPGMKIESFTPLEVVELDALPAPSSHIVPTWVIDRSVVFPNLPNGHPDLATKLSLKERRYEVTSLETLTCRLRHVLDASCADSRTDECAVTGQDVAFEPSST